MQTQPNSFTYHSSLVKLVREKVPKFTQSYPIDLFDSGTKMTFATRQRKKLS